MKNKVDIREKLKITSGKSVLIVIHSRKDKIKSKIKDKVKSKIE